MFPSSFMILILSNASFYEVSRSFPNAASLFSFPFSVSVLEIYEYPIFYSQLLIQLVIIHDANL